MPEPDAYAIPEPSRRNLRFVKHLLRRGLGPADSTVRDGASLSPASASGCYFGAAEELVLDPELAAKRAAFERLLRKRCAARIADADVRRVVFVANAWQRVGGVISIGMLVDDLAGLGIDAKIVALNPGGYAEGLVHSTEPMFFASRRDFVRHFPAADVVISTYWATLYHVMHVFLNRPEFIPAYFVQDFEPLFYPAEAAMRIHVETTYRMTPFGFAKSDWVCQQVRACGGQIERVPPAIDLERFSPASGKAERSIVLAMVRPSTPRRNAEGTLRVLESIRQQRPEVRIEIFGSSDAELAGCGIKGPFENLGNVSNESLPAVYSRATLFLDCSEFHGFGRTVAEALACGTPCVATRSGGVEDFCRHEENALLTAPGAEAELVSACLRVLDDRGLCARLTRNARESVTVFDRRASAKATLDVLRRYVSEPGKFVRT